MSKVKRVRKNVRLSRGSSRAADSGGRIDYKVKWVAGSILYDPQQDQIMEVLTANSKMNIAITIGCTDVMEGLANRLLYKVELHPEDTPGVNVWTYLGSLHD